MCLEDEEDSTCYKAEVEERCAAAAVHKLIQGGRSKKKKKKFSASIIANSRGESLELGHFSHLPTPGHQLWKNGEALLFSLYLFEKF